MMHDEPMSDETRTVPGKAYIDPESSEEIQRNCSSYTSCTQVNPGVQSVLFH